MAFRFLLGLGLILRLALLLVSASHPDVGNHLDWGDKFWQYGPQNFYQQSIWKVSWPNQPIGSIYLFAFLSQVYHYLFNFFWYLNLNFPIFPSKLIFIFEANLHVWLVKIPFVLADIAIAYFIYRLTRNKALMSIFLFNPAVIYNSTIWGQTDSLINFLSLTGIYLIYRQKYFPGISLFLGSLLFKMSLLIYLPIAVWLLYLNRHQWRRWLVALLIFLSLTALISLPFALPSNPFSWFYHLYRDLVFNRQGNMLNGNAFNLWLIIYGVSLSRQSTPLISLVGIAVFSVFTLPVIVKFIRHKFATTSLWQVLFFISFGSFLSLTNMHERYLYPIFPLIPLLIHRRFFGYKTAITLTIIHFVNLYHLWYYPSLPFFQILLQSFNHFLPKVLSFALLAIYLKYWLKYFRHE